MYEITSRESGGYVWYGIRHTGTGQEVKEISTDRVQLGGLVEQMNRGGLSPVHMPDVTEDFLAEGVK